MPKFYERTDIAKEENINFASFDVYRDTDSTRIRRTDLYMGVARENPEDFSTPIPENKYSVQ